jgi:hypothetical protein
LTHPNSSSTPKKTSKCKGNKNKVDGNPLQSIPLKQPVNPETRGGQYLVRFSDSCI